MLYFAYGSNLDWNQMRKRCPSAKFCGMAVLRGHRLAFTRLSRKRGCGAADVIPAAGSNVWGVVYEITEREVEFLDKSEGYRPGRETNSYIRKECQVAMEGDDDSPMAVVSYFAHRENNPPLPNQEYKVQILGGARFWHLPEEYIINTLEAIEVSMG